MKPPPIHSKAFSFISSSNFVHMVSHTTPASATLGPAHSVQSPTNEAPRCPPSSAAVAARLAAIFRHFGEEAGIRVPRSPSVYTHRERAVTE